jgi:class 3 adenylate cyclase
MAPTIQYARSGEATLAYMVVGDGPVDLVFSFGNQSHIEHVWDEPGLARFFERLAAFTRLILYDRRGVGMSDPLAVDAPDDHDVDDLGAVMDATGSERAILMGYTTGGPTVVSFAAKYPERVSALVLYATIARAVSAPGYDWTHNDAERKLRIEALLASWGTGANFDRVAPSLADDDRVRAWYARLERLSNSPGTMARMAATFQSVDIRELLPTLAMPTLIIHRAGDRLIDVRHSRFLAEQIPGAQYVELPGEDNLPSAGDSEAILGEIEQFVTGGRRESERDRALLTVLFTDIVDATVRAQQLGDKRWRDLLHAHDQAVRREVARFDGSEIKTIGDAFLIVFDGAPSRAVRCARAIIEAAAALDLPVRIGLHTGECEIIGEDIGGMAVHIASRVAGVAQAGEVLTSGTTYGTVVGSGLSFESRGEHALKGVSGQWPIFALTD